MNGIIKNNQISNQAILDYLINHEEYFINILDKFNKNYSTIPENIGALPFNTNNQLDSMLAFTHNGYYFPFIKDEFIDATAEYLNSNMGLIFSIYGKTPIMKKLLKLLRVFPRYYVEYHVMLLIKDNLKQSRTSLNGYQCIQCDKTHFTKLKKLQYLYHQEEVYTDGSYYPYQGEMRAYKKLLDDRLNFAVFTDDSKNIAVSKVNVNGESPNMFQLGGIYTRKEYRNNGLSKLCLLNLINHIFDNNLKEKVILFVKKNNLPAIKLYENLGFDYLYESTLSYF